MPPKKAAAETSTSPRKMPEKLMKEDTKTGSQKDTAASEAPKPVRKGSSHPSAMVMVKEALKVLDQRKGVSAYAIRNFIKEKYTSVDQTKLQSMVRKALVKGLESSVFVKPPNSATTKGVQGRFRLAVSKPTKDPKAAKKSKESKENTNPNVGEGEGAKAKPGAAKEKPAKKRSATEGDKPKAKKDASASKVVQAKKPKSKRSAETDKPKANKKTGKESKNDGEDSGKSSNKTGEKAAQEEGTNDGAGAVAPKKGKKDLQKAEGGDKMAEATAPKKGKKAAQAEDGEQNGTAAPKATGKKGKKAAEK